MKEFSLKKSMLMLLALFVLGACSNYDDEFLDKAKNKEVALTDGGSAVYYFSTDGKTVYSSLTDSKVGTFEKASDENTATYIDGSSSTTAYTKDGKTGYMKGDLTSGTQVNVYLSEKE